jgi:hypothetical protein
LVADTPALTSSADAVAQTNLGTGTNTVRWSLTVPHLRELIPVSSTDYGESGVNAETRLARHLAALAYQRALEAGWSHLFDNELAGAAASVGATDQETRQVVRELCEHFLLYEDSPGFFKATPAMLLYHEQFDRAAAYRQNEIRRHILQETGRLERPEAGSFVVFRADETDPYPAGELFTAANVLDAQGLISVGDRGLPAHFTTRLTSGGYDALQDDRQLARLLPITGTEDEEAQAPVAPDALNNVITSCEELLEHRGWKQALVELRRADGEYEDGDWVNAVRDYYTALESGLKYALGDEEVAPDDGRALKRLAGRAADGGLIPVNYQALFGYLDSVRSPRSHGGGPQAEKVGEVEVGRAEALLLGNLARTLLLYIGQRPPVLST